MVPNTSIRLLLIFVVFGAVHVNGETLRHALSLEQQLRMADLDRVTREVRRRGDPRRGAVLFYTSVAGCASCHVSQNDQPPVGPDLTQLGDVTDQHLVESLIDPSKSIRKGFETYRILMLDGRVLTGMIVDENDQQIRIRSASDVTRITVIDRDDVEAIRIDERSLMPDGLVASLPEQRDFLDLAKYVIEVAHGGPERANELKPSPDQLTVVDDTAGLDHAGIIRKLGKRDYSEGERIFQGYCFNCHGRDGNTPSLPTARAFGTQKLKFGADAYRMFLTLSHGNGLMAPMTHLTPKQRYQVVHYIREKFMKPSNPDYVAIDQAYLEGLPKGESMGDEIPDVQRDFGPVLASQLRRDYSSVLTVHLGSITASYDLHTMDLAEVWRDGFLDLSETQHVRPRGEGTANPRGTPLSGFYGWEWAHGQSFDHSHRQVYPRGPIPSPWFDYDGYNLVGDHVVFRYQIDGRSVAELPYSSGDGINHVLEIGPGETLLLSVAQAPESKSMVGVVPVALPQQHDLGLQGVIPSGDAQGHVVIAGEQTAKGLESFFAAAVRGDLSGMTWHVDDSRRLVLTIPADQKTRIIEVATTVGKGDDAIARFAASISRSQHRDVESPLSKTDQNPLHWPDPVTTVGTLGWEPGGYALDTITLPDQTPWNTWFRTSAIDFFPDGRLVVTTYGGDVWIVSGVDDELLDLRWKRFAAGLYEPFGVKVVDGSIFVTCKDRLVKLHDLNGDGEADFYESFSADTDVSVNFHAFNFDLQTDQAGNFYYAKSGHGGDSEIPGCVMKISPDGKQREVYCTGFRSPNGMGMLPDGRPTVSDNQGQWMPASKISLVRPGGFYGWVQTYSIPGMWAPGGGKIDVTKVVPPDSFDQPLVWMPQEFDNSSGGQVWVDDSRFGPLSGHLMHTSFGKGWMYYLMMQEVDEEAQAAIIKLPFDFRTGIMRARVNPADGQVYATGLQGWNGGGRIGLLDGGIQRLRYTGKPHRMITDCQAGPRVLELRFNFPLDRTTAIDPQSYTATYWNYHWGRQYGSDQFSPITDQVGIETLSIERVSLDDQQTVVRLHVPDLIPVNQIHLIVNVNSVDGTPFEEEIYWTINRLPKD